MDKREVEHKIEEASSFLKDGHAERAELWMTRLLAEDEDMSDSDRAILRAQATELMGRAQFAMNRYDEALGTMRSAAQELQDWLANHQYDANDETQKRIGSLLSGILVNLCFACMERKLVAEAENIGQEAIAVTRQYAGADSHDLARALFGVSVVWYRQRDFAKAAQMLEEALSIFQKHDDRKMAAFCFNNLGRIYEEQGNFEKGASFHQKAVEIRRTLPDELELAFSLGNLGAALASLGRWGDAETALSEAVEIYHKKGKEDLPEYIGFIKNLEICRKAQKEDSK